MMQTACRIALVAAVLGLLGLANGQALTGLVRSAEEGPVEGVLISAQRVDTPVTITVVTDATGRYTFPRNRLDPGRYTIHVRATGYDLEDPSPVDIAANKTATADLKLAKTTDLASQLSNAEWLLSMPSPDDQKGFPLNCVNCLTSKLEDFVPVNDSKSRLINGFPTPTRASAPRRAQMDAEDGFGPATTTERPR